MDELINVMDEPYHEKQAPMKSKAAYRTASRLPYLLNIFIIFLALRYLETAPL